MLLIIDVGNTRVKLAVFERDSIVEKFIFDKSEIVTAIESVILKFPISKSIISSVASIPEKDVATISTLISPLFLNHATKVPFVNLYDTPTTLGVDRIALAAAAVRKYENKNCLVIDAGTCITYDFISSKKEYFGGAISPGIAMRFRALHEFTSKLPLVSDTESFELIGNNTNASILSGVLNGVCFEISGLIDKYKSEYQDLTVVLTGGDTKFLSKQLKSGIFANPNFVLEGLHTILIYNSKDD
ncbi:type III pantothenate kinase [Tenacibaculum sp. SG-28]|uniref:type III pantothenate kinase n=1 Tax=Tenacibaculum sp. SG-28 TaxID=754426 RepID=UPI000CF45672|nr:type III pantothenate kinase [Tenacibaculum sp. SG-28]PQJ22936.1 pantothenate kinase [Tenacibaculum sp. SG-28]